VYNTQKTPWQSVGSGKERMRVKERGEWRMQSRIGENRKKYA